MKAIQIAVAVSLIATSAQADWQYTSWGMTVDEVVSASKGQTTPINDAGKNGKAWQTLLVAPYTGSGQKFRSYFRFDNRTKKLMGVDLQLDDVSKCASVYRTLRASYGTPSDVDDFSVLRKNIHTTTDWRDLKQGNLISFYELTGTSCSLRYFPLVEEGPKGEL